MKTRVILTFCVVFVLGVVSHANAQATLVAGSLEDKAFTACANDQGVDAQIEKCLEFKKQFPNSKATPDANVILINAYRNKNETAKVNEIGEETIRLDPTNVTALMAVSRNYAMEKEKKNIDKAITYATKAVETIGKWKTEPRYNEDAAWKQYLDSIENSAKANLTYAKAMRP